MHNQFLWRNITAYKNLYFLKKKGKHIKCYCADYFVVIVQTHQGTSINLQKLNSVFTLVQKNVDTSVHTGSSQFLKHSCPKNTLHGFQVFFGIK